MSKWRHQEIFQYIQNNFNKDIKILELGPGDGTMLFSLHEQGYKHLCYVDKANNFKYPIADEEAEGHLVDLNNGCVPYQKSSFDLIIALQILEHLENPWHFKRECVRLLKPAGYLILSIPHGHNLASRIRFFLKGNVMRWEKKNPHITFFTTNVFHKLFLNDFIIEKIDYSQATLKHFGLRINLPNTNFLKKYFAANIYYIMKKK